MWSLIKGQALGRFIHCEDFFACLVSQSRGQFFSQRNVFPASSACKRGRKWGSLTLKGRLRYESGCQFHTRPCDSVRIFLATQCHSFVRFCVWKTAYLIQCYQVITPKLRTTSFWPNILCTPNVFLYCCVAGKMHPVCEKFSSFRFSCTWNHAVVLWAENVQKKNPWLGLFERWITLSTG